MAILEWKTSEHKVLGVGKVLEVTSSALSLSLSESIPQCPDVPC